MVRPLQPDGRVHGVIAGCRDAQGRWLVIRRGLNIDAAPGRVCLPGGAMEVGESQRSALVRELKEELGVGARPVRCVWHRVYDQQPLTLWAWLAELDSFELNPDPVEVAETIWLSTEQATHHPDALPYHGQILTALSEAIQG